MVANHQEWFPGQHPRPEFHASEERLKRSSARFFPLFHRVLAALEAIVDLHNNELVAVPNPITSVPPEYIHNKLRTKLEYCMFNLVYHNS
jgi:hypothetical protein